MSAPILPAEVPVQAGSAPGEPQRLCLNLEMRPKASLPAGLRRLTPARIGLNRTGSSLATGELLEFQLAHARARDAVHARLQPALLAAALRDAGSVETLLLHSAAPDRQTYLQRPDLGRKLAESSRERLRKCTGWAESAPAAGPETGLAHRLAIVLADGLSALAVERHAAPLLEELLARLAECEPGLGLAPISIVEQGRVAIGDEIGQALGAALVLVLIGERPGLSSPDSLGAYLTWLGPARTDASPRITDAERNCVSNIRQEGLSYAQAAARILALMQEALRHKLTGVALGAASKLAAGVAAGVAGELAGDASPSPALALKAGRA